MDTEGVAVIKRQEILDFADRFRLRPDTVEKDYVLGWVLAAISADKDLAGQWVFKGGTCLKKCYFETYRFSEDLDFTLLDVSHLNETFLVEKFKGIAVWVYDNSGIDIPMDSIRFPIHEDPRGMPAAQGKIGYRGPLRSGSTYDPPRIKFDLTADEILVLDPASRPVLWPYSDNPSDQPSIDSYSFEELFAEKIRALGERLRPRDLYDVVYLYRITNPNLIFIRQALQEKCEYKQIPLITWALIEGHLKRVELEREWVNMLKHQLPSLPPFEYYWKELPLVFQWLEGKLERVDLASIPVSREGTAGPWQPSGFRTPWLPGRFLELLRYAAVNHLCVVLGYKNTHRVIEPYSLRQTQDNHILLEAIKRGTGAPRSYRVDRIESVEVTNEPFEPRYRLEFPFEGPIKVPAKRRKS